MKLFGCLLGFSLAVAVGGAPAGAQRVYFFPQNPVTNACAFAFTLLPVFIYAKPGWGQVIYKADVTLLYDDHPHYYWPMHNVDNFEGAICSFNDCIEGKSIWLTCVGVGAPTIVEFRRLGRKKRK